MPSKFAKHIYLTATIVILVVFVIGILLGTSLKASPEHDIIRYIRSTELNTESYVLEEELTKGFDIDTCDFATSRIEQLSDELAIIGRKLTADDAESVLGQEDFHFLKRKYHLMQIRTYLKYYQLRKHCNGTTNIVLFYYDPNSESSQKQGKVLDKLVSDFGIRVFAIQHLYSKELDFVESLYAIQTTPTLIINFNKKITGLADYTTLTRQFENESA